MKAYILGAGASLHAGYPLASGLWPDLAAWMEQSDNERFRNLKRNIETNHSTQSQDMEQWSSELYEGDQRDLRHAIADLFDELRPVRADAYYCFADKCIQPGDTIVSFNYDVSLERELKRAGKWEVKDGYGFDINPSCESTSPVKLLKLHGSTNWWADPQLNRTVFSTVALGSRYVIKPEDLEFLGYQNLRDYQSTDKNVSFERGVVLPVPNKSFHIQFGDERLMPQFWNDLWRQAEDCLRECEELTIVGYSFPEADSRARKLIIEKTDREAKISIFSLDQSARIARTFCDHGFRDVHPFNNVRFEDWVRQL